MSLSITSLSHHQSNYPYIMLNQDTNNNSNNNASQPSQNRFVYSNFNPAIRYSFDYDQQQQNQQQQQQSQQPQHAPQQPPQQPQQQPPQLHQPPPSQPELSLPSSQSAYFYGTPHKFSNVVTPPQSAPAYQSIENVSATSGSIGGLSGSTGGSIGGGTSISSSKSFSYYPPFKYPQPPQSAPFLTDIPPRFSYSGPQVGSPQFQETTVPRLVRTTSLPINRVSPVIGHSSLAPQQTPETMKYPRASLQILGDLSAITQNWTPQELSNKRRLVKFEWTQVGAKVNLRFEPISQEDYDPSTTAISCLLFQDNNGQDYYYVTSVDVISLLERLVNQRFAVEEKNRIRRNLQGLRPLTINKNKKPFGEFFKQIMKYLSPRPRNIEKDVKVFDWANLADALLKVMSKYSCDFSQPMQQTPNLPLAPPSAPASSYSESSPQFNNSPGMLQAHQMYSYMFQYPQQQQNHHQNPAPDHSKTP